LFLPLGDHFRLGIAAKDLVPEDFEAKNGNIVQLRPRGRFGAGFSSERFDFGIDVDLQKNYSLAAEAPTQEATAGFEWRTFRWLAIRGGYRQDMDGVREDIVSGGVAFRVGRFLMEASAMQSDDVSGGGLQLGWAF
jgi:hypothetical protein